MARFAAYFFATMVATGSVCSYAYVKKEQQFFPAAVWMATSKFCIMVLAHQLFVILLGIGRFLKSIFLGKLRDDEVRYVFRNSRFLVAESVVMMMIFKDEMNVSVVALFGLMLTAKIFHWLCSARVNHIDKSQSEDTGAFAHLRVFALMCTLLALDVAMTAIASYRTLKGGTSVRMVFCFEFLLLTISIVSIFLRYLLHLVDFRLAGTWQSKAGVNFVLQLGADCWATAVAGAYLLAHFTFYGVPPHIIRLLWTCLTTIRRRIVLHAQQRRVTSALQDELPDATRADIEALEGTDADCVICRTELPLPGQVGPQSVLRAKRLACGHIIRLKCLQTWMLRGKTKCPVCRAPVLPDRDGAEDTGAAAAAAPATPATPAGTPARAENPFRGEGIRSGHRPAVGDGGGDGSDMNATSSPQPPSVSPGLPALQPMNLGLRQRHQRGQNATTHAPTAPGCPCAAPAAASAAPPSTSAATTQRQLAAAAAARSSVNTGAGVNTGMNASVSANGVVGMPASPLLLPLPDLSGGVGGLPSLAQGFVPPPGSPMLPPTMMGLMSPGSSMFPPVGMPGTGSPMPGSPMPGSPRLDSTRAQSINGQEGAAGASPFIASPAMAAQRMQAQRMQLQTQMQMQHLQMQMQMRMQMIAAGQTGALPQTPQQRAAELEAATLTERVKMLTTMLERAQQKHDQPPGSSGTPASNASSPKQE